MSDATRHPPPDDEVPDESTPDQEFLDRAIEEWIQRSLDGDELDPMTFARERNLSPELLGRRIRQARWLLARHEESRGTRAPELPTPPFDLGTAEVIEEAGRGGMGVVYRGVDRVSGQTVAVKILGPGRGDTATGRARFQREARVAQRLDHPNVVRVIDAGEHDGLSFIVMEWVDGSSLATELSRRSTRAGVDPEVHRRTATMFAKLARALHHAHEHGLLHRDVKPANILLADGDEPKLADFGLVRDVGAVSLTGTGDVVGSPAYMSPEQLLGKRDLTARSDVYSLGVTLYECLTLRRPFAADSVPATQRQILRDSPSLPRSHAPDVPEALQWICLRAMAREPDVRYPSALAFAEDLEAFSRGAPVTAAPPSLALRSRRFLRRHRGWIEWLSAAVVLVGVSLIAWNEAEQARRSRHAALEAGLGEVLLKGNRTDVLAKYDEAVAAFPEDRGFLLGRAIARLDAGLFGLRRGSFARAQEDLETLQSLASDSDELGMSLVIDQTRAVLSTIRQNELTEADRSALSQLLEFSDSLPKIRVLRGDLLRYLGRWRLAQRHYEAAIEADATLRLRLSERLSTCLEKLGDPKAAWRHYDLFTATRDAPDLVYRRVQKSWAAADRDAAAAELAHLRKRWPASAYTTASELLIMDRGPEALHDAAGFVARGRQAADWEAASTTVLSTLATLHAQTGDTKGAIDLWRELLTIRSTDSNMRSLLGITLFSQGDQEQGLDELRRAAKDAAERPHERDYHQGMLHFFSGEFMVGKGEAASAKQEFQSAVNNLHRSAQMYRKDPTRFRPLAYALVQLESMTEERAQKIEILREAAAAQATEARLLPRSPVAQTRLVYCLTRLVPLLEAAGAADVAAVRERLASAQQELRRRQR